MHHGQQDYGTIPLWFIKTKRCRVFDAGGASLEGTLCMAWSSTTLRVPRSARERLDCQDPGLNLPPILTAKEFGSELEIVRPRLCSGDADHRVAAGR